MDDFNTIRLKRKTIVKFKEYSKKVSPNYSETLDYMIAFFEDNDLSPYDTLKDSMTSVSNRLNKRMDAVATILKNMEKIQLIPTRELLKSLFDEVEEEEKQPLLVEKMTLEEPKLITENEELTYYREAYYKQQAELNKFKYEFKETLENFKLIKNPFGVNQYILKLTLDQYKELNNNFNGNSFLNQ